MHISKWFSLIILSAILFAFNTTAVFAQDNQVADIEKTVVTKQKTKRCPCKKIFVKTMNLTDVQVELMDKNRKAEKEEIKKLRLEIEKVKAKHDQEFENILTVEQKKTLAKLKADKKKGKSCCHCRKNPYY